MTKASYSNNIFYVFLIIYFSISILSFSYSLINKFSNLVLIGLLLKTGILILIIAKNKHSKDAIKAWSGFLIGAASVIIISHLISKLLGGEEINFSKILSNSKELFFGLILYFGANKFITNVDTSPKIEDHLIDIDKLE